MLSVKTNCRRNGFTASRSRRGAVMLLCMLAAVVIAGAVLGLARSHQQTAKRIESRRAVVQATEMSSSLYQRALVVARNNPSFSGRIDPMTKSALGSYALVSPVSKTETAISVYAYDKATVPAVHAVVDLTAFP